MTEELVEAEVVDEPGAELVPSNLFRSDNPAEVLKRATDTANAFKPILNSQSVNIQGKQHVTVEGWTTLGAMLGITPVCEWTRKLDNGWEARVEARTLDGRVVGAAEAECLRDEARWKTADDYAVRSMAQTRATSKALGSVLRFVATLAGASGTPAEEVPAGGFKRTGFASDKQRNFMERLLTEKVESAEDRVLITEWAQSLPTGQVSKAIDALKDDPDGAERLVTAARKLASEQAAQEHVDSTDLSDPPPEDEGTLL